MTENNWQRRWHPVLKEWVVISARTSNRPWSGMEFNDSSKNKPQHDKDCYLCPRVERASGASNPNYQSPWAFDNDFASLSLDAPTFVESKDPLRRIESAKGLCRVMCWHPRHDLSLAALDDQQMLDVVKLWKQEYQSLSETKEIQHILMFENKGKEIGVSNPHPHGQIYASAFIPKQIQEIRQSQAEYAQEHGSHLILDWLLKSQEDGLSVVENEFFIAAVPFAARFPYETWITSKRKLSHLGQLQDHELPALASIYQEMAKRYNGLFKREAPNITLIQNAPVDSNSENDSWQFHIVMQPPLRDSSKLKYLAGFESGTNCIVNPVQPEQAAASLRAVQL